MTDPNPPRPGANGPLQGLRVFDITRVLAGPSCTQFLGDLGADVIKVERPGQGDDTRGWGPPFLKDEDGNDTTESAYFLSANRNKRSLTIDFTKPEGQALARRLIAECDIVIENFKVGSLAKYGLDYASLRSEFPSLIYCSITGFGQTGPYAERPGYDFLAQGMGGVMSITGETDGTPQKVGIAIADMICGMHGAIAILAALHHRTLTGEGQMIDLSLLDSQAASLSYMGMFYLVTGENPPRLGNAHPCIVPYTVVPTSDGHVIVAAGNDGQFARFCDFAGVPELAENEKFSTNQGRIVNRDELTALIVEITAKQPSKHWLEGLETVNVPCGPVNTVDEVFEDPQVKARGIDIAMNHPAAGPEPVHFMACPMAMSATPPSYRNPPPMLGQHTDEVLAEILDIGADEIAGLRDKGLI
jgi:crotonobetainyl-CoA:carnitine CoA-transferase CaiB-like acyl-CoA transferase